jgi:hypothetical protein
MAPPQNPFAPRLPRFAPRPPGFPGGSPFGGGGPNPVPAGNGTPFGAANINNNNNNGNNSAGGLNFGGAPATGMLPDQLQQAGITPEEQVILMEAERQRLQDLGAAAPYSPILIPNTALTPKGPSENDPAPR